MSSPAATEPWLHPAVEVATALDTDLDNGLTTAEATDRLARVGPNRLDPPESVSTWRTVLHHLADPLVYLLLGAVVVSFAAWLIEGRPGVPFEVIVILAIVALNAVLGYVQQARAEEAVAALARMTAINAGVVRDGVERRIPAAELVPGDVLVLAEGDAVSADARLVEAAALHVAEAALTGESEAVLKDPATLAGRPALGDRLNMVAAGTAVTRGRGRAVVTATGMHTEMGAVARLLAETEADETPLQREVARIGAVLGVAVVAIAVVVTGTILVTSDISTASDLVEVLLVGVSLAVAAVPEGLPAILSVVLGLGVLRMARERAIVKRLASVESLGSASVVCTDKTGTVTKNEMTIEVAVTASGEVTLTGTGYRPEGEVLVDGTLLEDPVLLDEVHDLIGAGSLANDAVLSEHDDEWTIQGDPTEAAFLVAEAKLGRTDARLARFERVGEVPFTSERRLMSTLQTDRRDETGVVVTTKGAPDVLLERCTHERAREVVRPLTDERRRQVLAAVDRLADQALRTLGVAYRLVPDDADLVADESLERELVYLGMVGIIDPPRPEARDAIAEARAAGVRVVLITGDHPRTAARIAGDLGIVEPGARALTGVELDGLDPNARSAAVAEVSVYARVSPQNKLQIVDLLQAQGHVVAMTGDGVNDAPALKSADIGVAMGVTGTEVAKEAADMILADDNIATIVTAVREGRAIFANIRSFLRFLLSSNVGEVLTVFFGVVLATTIGIAGSGESIATPLLATQILWINLLTDTGPALALGVDPPRDDLMRRPPRRRTDRVIDTEMLVGIGWVGVVMAAVTLLALDSKLPGGIIAGSSDITHGRTMAFTTLVLAQLFNCFNARSDRRSAFHGLFTNPLLWGAIATSALLQVAVVHVPLMNDAFDTTPLDWSEWAVCVALASCVLWADELRKLVAGLSRGGS
jgi:P-type Ca2+ transporter type 2C